MEVVMLSAGGFAGAVLPCNTGSTTAHNTSTVVILYRPARLVDILPLRCNTKADLIHTRYVMSTQSHSLRLADQLSGSPYAWPGGYPLYALTHDGGVLCHECCKSERSSIGTTTGSDGWCVESLRVNWEDADLHCDHCGSRIESAYAESDT